MSNWYHITNMKLMIVLGIALLWIFAGWTLYALIGVDHGPKGGIDSIGNAIAYVFVWKLFINVPPILFSAVGFSLWLYQSFVCNILESLDEMLPNGFQGLTPPVFSHFLK